MDEVRVAFDIKGKDHHIEPGREYLECYMIFDVKMDFTRKARFVANVLRPRISPVVHMLEWYQERRSALH